MPRGQSGARRPATKFAQLQKKIGRQTVQRNLQSQTQAGRAQQTSFAAAFGKSIKSATPPKPNRPPKEP